MSELEKILYGADERQGIVGIDCDEENTTATVFIRENGKLIEESEPFEPFFLVDSLDIFERAGAEVGRVVELAGESGFKYLILYPTISAYQQNLKKIASFYRKNKDDFEEEPYYEIRDFTHQYMLITGKTHFLGLEWEDVRTAEVTVKLNVIPEFADPRRDEQVMLVLALSSGDEELILDLNKMNEPEMIEAFIKKINEWDPDVICGHNLFKITLRFILERAKRYRIPVNIGRKGKMVVSETYRMSLAERRLEFPRAHIFGRSLVDSWLLVQAYDIFKREMDSYDLAYSAEFLGLRGKPRETFSGVAPGENFTRYIPRAIMDAKEDLKDIKGIVSTLITTFFYFCQMLPYDLEETIIRGNATKINSFFLREYLRRRRAIPYPVEARWYEGAYTELRKIGVIRPVISADVASLYPSLILTRKLFPPKDSLNLYETILKELLDRRLKIKESLKKLSRKDAKYHRLDARQGTFKIIINSFYGYLGTSRMNFADIDTAEKVTAEGQETVKKMAEVIEELGGEIIEIDTDGIYLRPPEKFIRSKRYGDFIELINKEMPKGITVELGGVYPAMLSYKVKNYALLTEDGRLIIKGSGLKSRGLEPFLRTFIEESIRLILMDKVDEVDKLYERYQSKLEDNEFSVFELAKTETLVDSLDTYEKKVRTTRRNRQAQYEVAKRCPVELKPGDSVTYYISGDDPKVKAYEAAKHVNDFNPDKSDINIAYYQKRLEHTYKRVKGFVAN